MHELLHVTHSAGIVENVSKTVVRAKVVAKAFGLGSARTRKKEEGMKRDEGKKDKTRRKERQDKEELSE